MVLQWSEPAQKLVETGLDHGILNVDGLSYAWNGLIAMDEAPSGGEVEPLYFDGVKYYDFVKNEEFQGTLRAFSYPPQFEQCMGVIAISPGLSAGGQVRKTFNMAYRTKVFDGLGRLSGHKLHLLYGCTATTTPRSYRSIDQSTTPMEMQWTITCTPPPVVGANALYPVGQIVLDSNDDPDRYSQVQDDLDSGNFPPMEEVVDLYEDIIILGLDWTDIPLEDSMFYYTADPETSGIPLGYCEGGEIKFNPAATGHPLQNYMEFRFPNVKLDMTKSYEVEITGAETRSTLWLTKTTRNGEFINHVNGPWKLASDNEAPPSPSVVHEIGPGILDWDAAASQGNRFLAFEIHKDSIITSIRIREVLNIVPATGAFDLSTAVFHYDPEWPSAKYGEYSDGALRAIEGRQLTFHFPDFPLTRFDRDKTYKLTITFGVGNVTLYVSLESSEENTNASWWDGTTNIPLGSILEETPPHEIVFGADAEFYEDYAMTPEGYLGLIFTQPSAYAVITAITWEEV